MTNDITLEELSGILEARYAMNVLFISRLNGHFFRETGTKIENLLLEPKIVHWFFELVARRLLDNDRSKPLISNDDLTGLLIYLNNGQPIGLEDEAEAAIFLEELRKRVSAFMQEAGNHLPGQNPYEEYWRWVTTIRFIANEEGVDLAGGYDEVKLIKLYDKVVRHLYSKDQFLAYNMREDQLAAMKEERINMVRANLLRMDPQAGQDRLNYIKTVDSYIKQQVEPEIDKVIATIRRVRGEFVTLEAARIYG